MKKNLIASVAFVALSMLATSAYAGGTGTGGEGGGSGSALALAAVHQSGKMEVDDNWIGDNNNHSWNKIDDDAFENAKGAFQVQQNTGTNVQQQGDVTVAAIIGCDCGSSSAAIALTYQSAKLEVDSRICDNDNNSNNLITDHAFKNAQGAFSVQQNTGTNVQQQSNVTVAAIIGKSH